MLGSTWGMWFALQIQAHSCFLIVRNCIYCHKISHVDNSGKRKRKYFQWVRAFSCVTGLNAEWCQLVPSEDNIRLWWVSELHFYTTGSSPFCYPLCTYLCQERWAQNVFQIGCICSCSVKRWHRLHSQDKSKSLPLKWTSEFLIYSSWKEINP